jgi:hypothetical protein
MTPRYRRPRTAASTRRLIPVTLQGYVQIAIAGEVE